MFVKGMIDKKNHNKTDITCTAAHHQDPFPSLQSIGYAVNGNNNHSYATWKCNDLNKEDVCMCVLSMTNKHAQQQISRNKNRFGTAIVRSICLGAINISDRSRKHTQGTPL